MEWKSDMTKNDIIVLLEDVSTEVSLIPKKIHLNINI